MFQFDRQNDLQMKQKNQKKQKNLRVCQIAKIHVILNDRITQLQKIK